MIEEKNDGRNVSQIAEQGKKIFIDDLSPITRPLQTPSKMNAPNFDQDAFESSYQQVNVDDYLVTPNQN